MNIIVYSNAHFDCMIMLKELWIELTLRAQFYQVNMIK